MKDAIGNTYSLAYVLVLIFVIASFMAYVINYNRAFQVKNKLLEVIRDSEYSRLDNAAAAESINTKIKNYKDKMGYSAGLTYIDHAKGEGWTCPAGYGWCYKVYPESDIYSGEDIEYSYVKVMTFVSIDVPIINRILPNFSVFQVTGSTVPVVTVKSRE